MSKVKMPWSTIGLSLFYLVVLFGIGYSIYEWSLTGKIEDRFFIGILMANTYAIYRFCLFFFNHLEGVFDSFESSFAGLVRSKSSVEFVDCFF